MGFAIEMKHHSPHSQKTQGSLSYRGTAGVGPGYVRQTRCVGSMVNSKAWSLWNRREASWDYPRRQVVRNLLGGC